MKKIIKTLSVIGIVTILSGTSVFAATKKITSTTPQQKKVTVTTTTTTVVEDDDEATKKKNDTKNQKDKKKENPPRWPEKTSRERDYDKGDRPDFRNPPKNPPKDFFDDDFDDDFRKPKPLPKEGEPLPPKKELKKLDKEQKAWIRFFFSFN